MNKDKGDILEFFSTQLSSWIYDLEKENNTTELLQLLSYPLQDTLDTIREASKVLRVLESYGIWTDRHGNNAGIKREGRSDGNLKAAIALGEKLKGQNASFDIIIEGIASSLNLEFSEVKLFETGSRRIALEIQTEKELNVNVRDLLLKIKGAGIIIDDIVKINGKELILSIDDKEDSIHGFSEHKENDYGLLTEVI